MKQLSLLLKVVFNTIVLLILFTACDQKSDNLYDGSSMFNSDWAFTLDSSSAVTPVDLEGSRTPISWEPVSLPHTPRIEPLIVNDQWQGICWYRKDFEFKETWKGKHLYMRFEAAMNVADIWLNETHIYSHTGGYLPFTIDINPFLKEDGANRIYVRLNNEDNPITGPKPLRILDFNTYGGLYRDVKLIVKNEVHIIDEQFAGRKAGGGVFITYPLVSDEKAEIDVKAELINHALADKNIAVVLELNKDGKKVLSKRITGDLNAGEIKTFTSVLKLDNPELWSPAHPALYDLEISVIAGKEIMDYHTERIGIRKFEFKDNELYINGERTFLRGVNRHQEYPYVGYALSNNAQYRDARLIKEAGFDYVRLAHYPHSSAFLDACDELGLVTVNPILGWQFFNPDPAFSEQMIKDSRSLIRRDRNHACVLAWELSLNEAYMPETLIDSFMQAGREEYPFDGCYIAGWKEYGYDIYLQARQHRHSDQFPDKPYNVSEYGDWEYYAQNAGLNQDAWSDLKAEQRSSRQLLGYPDEFLIQQALNLQEAHNDNMSTTPAFADGYWVMFDYNRGYADDLEASGLMSILRQPKFSYYFYQSQREPTEEILGEEVGPMVFIASRMMDNNPEKIKVFSNCDEVELKVNDKTVVLQKPDQDAISARLINPPFTFHINDMLINEIRAIGYINGEEVAMDHRIRPGKVNKIEIKAGINGKGLTAGCNDMVFIYARLLDENNMLVTNTDQTIEFTVEGDATIAGNPSPEAEAGEAAILLIAGEKAGEIVITARLDSLISATLTLESISGK